MDEWGQKIIGIESKVISAKSSRISVGLENIITNHSDRPVGEAGRLHFHSFDR